MRVRRRCAAALSLALLIATSAHAAAAIPRPGPSAGFYTYDGTAQLQGTQPSGLFPSGMNVWVLGGSRHVRRLSVAVAYAAGQLRRFGLDVRYRGVAADDADVIGTGYRGVYGSITVDEARYQHGPRCDRVNGAPPGTVAEGVTFPGRQVVGGVQQVDLSDVTLCPDVFTRSAGVLTSTVLHEMGHAVGLGHFRGSYAGHEQIMNPIISSTVHYQQGDINGLRYVAAQTRRLAALSRVQGSVERWDVVAGTLRTGALRIGGWAVTGRARQRTLVELTVDGRVRAGALTTVSRPAVAARFPGTWPDPGFAIGLDALQAGRHRYCVRALSVLVHRGGTVLGCRVLDQRVLGAGKVDPGKVDPGRHDPGRLGHGHIGHGGSAAASAAARSAGRENVVPAAVALGLLVLVGARIGYRRRRMP